MSHISKISTKIQNLACLKKALIALDMDYTEAETGKTLTLMGFSKTEIIPDCIMEIKTGSPYSIGIRQTAGGCEIAADWWAVETFTGRKREDLVNGITRRYAYETVMDKVKAMGYAVVEEEEDARENLRVTVRRWGD